MDYSVGRSVTAIRFKIVYFCSPNIPWKSSISFDGFFKLHTKWFSFFLQWVYWPAQYLSKAFFLQIPSAAMEVGLIFNPKLYISARVNQVVQTSQTDRQTADTALPQFTETCSVCLSFYHLSVYLSARLSDCLFRCLPVWFICLSVCKSACFSFLLSVCLSI
jgi:hypothetical protein